MPIENTTGEIPLDGRLVDLLDPVSEEINRETAAEAAEALSALPNSEPLYVTKPDGSYIELPRSMRSFLEKVLEEAAHGRRVAALSVDVEEVTTTQVAQLLGVSRPHVVKLIEGGILPARFAGTHRRVRLADVLAYEQKIQRRRAALDELERDSSDLSLNRPPAHATFRSRKAAKPKG